jgi:hypothetical protein
MLRLYGVDGGCMVEYEIGRSDTGITQVLLITALQLLVQSFGLLNQFLPYSSILDKGLQF